jgi:exodeoxyribonuclease VIII
MKKCQHRETPIIGTIMGVTCKALLDCHGSEREPEQFILDDGSAQLDEDGEIIYCMVDRWVINDLKTTQDASPKGFAKAVVNFDLDLQMVWYQTLLANIEVLETPPFWIWTAIEKTPPYANSVYTGEEWIESGTRKLEIVIDRYKKCKKTGEWPMPYRGINKLERPKWATVEGVNQ